MQPHRGPAGRRDNQQPYEPDSPRPRPLRRRGGVSPLHGRRITPPSFKPSQIVVHARSVLYMQGLAIAARNRRVALRWFAVMCSEGRHANGTVGTPPVRLLSFRTEFGGAAPGAAIERMLLSGHV